MSFSFPTRSYEWPTYVTAIHRMHSPPIAAELDDARTAALAKLIEACDKAGYVPTHKPEIHPVENNPDEHAFMLRVRVARKDWRGWEQYFDTARWSVPMWAGKR